MQIYNTDTAQLIDLTYCDRSSDPTQRQDSAPDLVSGDPGIRFNPNEGRYESNAEAIDYWREYFTDLERGDDLQRDLLGLLNGSHDDPGEWIRENIDSHYFDHEKWPKQRIDLLSKAIEEKNF